MLLRRVLCLSVIFSVSLIAGRAAGQPVSPLQAVERLQATSSPGVVVVERSGRLGWVGSLREPVAGRTPSDMARDFLVRHGDLIGSPEVRDLRLRSVQDHGGTTFVTLEPTYQGLPVMGAQVVLALRGRMARHLASSISPWVAPAAGHDISSERAAQAVRDLSGLPARATERAWLPLGGELLPVWLVEQREAAPPHHWLYLVEATTGAVIWRHDQLLRNDGYVYDPNPWVAEGEYTRVELPGLESDEVLEGTLARAFQCGGLPEGDCTRPRGPCRYCGLREHLATADEEGNFLYEPSEPDLGDRFAEVQGYYHVSRINQWFEDTFGFIVSCGSRRAVDIHVNYHIPGDPRTSANAFYGDSDGDGCGDITTGEGLGVDLAYDADVIYHEFSHGVVAQSGGLGCGGMGVCLDDLGPDWTSLGLNEGYADYLAAAYTDDPEIGEHASAAFDMGHEGLRTGLNDRICPFDLVGESHYDGQIWLGTGWDLRETLGAETADWLMFHTLLALSNDAGYAEAAAALRESADEALAQGLLDPEGRAEVERIIGPEGRRIADCERIVPLDQVPEGHADEHLYLYSYMGAALPAGIQWSLTAPRRAQELRLWVEETRYRADWIRAHIRRGEPVQARIEFNPRTYRLDVTFTDDYAIDLEDNELVLTPETDPPLEEDTVYYISLETMCRQGCQILPRGQVTALPNDPPVAAAGPDLEVLVGDLVELDGSASQDPQGDELAFTWTRLSGPAVELEGADVEHASFVPQVAGMYTLGLTVTDLDGASDDDVIYIMVSDPEPDGPALDATGGGLECSCRAAAPSAPALLLRRLLGF